MTRKITLNNLHADEIQKMLKNKEFSRLVPKTCSLCGNREGFDRRMFVVEGLQIKDRDDEKIHGILKDFLRQRMLIERICLKTYGPKWIIDTARCTKCFSTDVVYDIDWKDAEMWNRVGKESNMAGKELKNDFEAFKKKMAAGKRS